MHNLVATVFKILGGSIILMILLDAGLVIADTISVNSRVTSLSITLQKEVAKNNCLPNALVPLFESQLNDIIDKSLVATSIKSNINMNLTVDSGIIPSLGESNVKDYGELQTLAIAVEMSPSRVVFADSPTGTVKSVNNIERQVGGSLSYTLNYEYTVPCLRYLK